MHRVCEAWVRGSVEAGTMSNTNEMQRFIQNFESNRPHLESWQNVRPRSQLVALSFYPNFAARLVSETSSCHRHCVGFCRYRGFDWKEDANTRHPVGKLQVRRATDLAVSCRIISGNLSLCIEATLHCANPGDGTLKFVLCLGDEVRGSHRFKSFHDTFISFYD